MEGDYQENLNRFDDGEQSARKQGIQGSRAKQASLICKDIIGSRVQDNLKSHDNHTVSKRLF